MDFDIKITQNISINKILSCIVNALDTGYVLSQCYDIESYKLPEGFNVRELEWLSMEDRDFYEGVRKVYFAPLVDGGYIDFYDRTEEEVIRLDFDKIKEGTKIMAEKNPKLFGQIMSGRGDSETDECFIQYCLHGEVLYG
jgi:hypothetical protein